MKEVAAGGELRIVYVLRDPEDRGAFLNLMSELKTVTTDLMQSVGTGPGEYSMTERPDRDGWFVEVLRFASEKERTRFDDLYSQDRRASALQSLLDELLDAQRSDYVLVRPALGN